MPQDRCRRKSSAPVAKVLRGPGHVSFSDTSGPACDTNSCSGIAGSRACTRILLPCPADCFQGKQQISHRGPDRSDYGPVPAAILLMQRGPAGVIPALKYSDQEYADIRPNVGRSLEAVRPSSVRKMPRGWSLGLRSIPARLLSQWHTIRFARQLLEQSVIQSELRFGIAAASIAIRHEQRNLVALRR